MKTARHLKQLTRALSHAFLSIGIAGLCALPAPAQNSPHDGMDAPRSYQLASSHDVPIHVQVTPRDNATTLRTNAGARVKGLTGLGWREIGHLAPDTALQVQTQSGGLRLTGMPGSEIYQGLRLEAPHDQALVATETAWYRGDLILSPVSGGFSIVNALPLEQYLYGVVPAEMPASWPIEALKAQAVAARTYALSHLGQYRKRGYDVASTTASQVYKGVKAEHSQSNRAVAETAGLILTYDGTPIDAYFHSTSGGRTENGADLWAPKAYLQPVDDVDHASPKYTWHEAQTQALVKARLRESLKTDLGEIVALLPASYTRGGRIKTLRVLGTRGEQTVAGERIRVALRLNSTFFNVGAVDAQGKLLKTPSANEVPTGFQFAGRGWGHGMGMSQWGARQLAADGYPFQSILGHYYRGTRLERLNPARYQLALGR